MIRVRNIAIFGVVVVCSGMPTGIRQFADARMKELILYVASYCHKAEVLGKLGGVKLNKILFYADFGAYLKLGQPITGQEYFALDWGPAPKRMRVIQEEMTASGELRIERAAVGAGWTQHIFIPYRAPNLSMFSAEEISLVDQCINRFILKSASDVSDESHEFLGWDSAELEEVIPYSSAYLDAPHILGESLVRKPSKTALTHARSLEGMAAVALGKHA